MTLPTEGGYISPDGTVYVPTEGNPAPNLPLVDESEFIEEEAS